MKRPITLAVILCLFAIGILALQRWRPVSAAPQPSPIQSRTAPESGVLPSSSQSPSPQTLATAVAAGIARKSAPGDAFQQFNRWTADYLLATESDRPEMLRDGARLANDRRTALARLIPEDPHRALEQAVPMVVRQHLPPEILTHLEERVSTEAFFGVLGIAPDPQAATPARPIIREVRLADGGRYEAYTFGNRLAQRTTERANITGIAVDGALAVDERPLRVLEAGEVPDRSKQVVATCPISGKVTPVDKTANSLPPITEETPAVEINGTIHYLCSGGHILAVEEQLLAGEGLSGGPTKPTGSIPGSWTTGPRTLLYMRVAFPETRREPQTEAAAYDMMRQVNDWFVENSYGSLYILPTITPLLVMPRSEAYYTSGGGSEYVLRTDAQNVARELGYDTSSYDLDIIVYTGGPGSFGGLGYVGGKGTWLKSITVGVACHELGHNFGVWHANFWNTSGVSAIGNGSNSEYGNIFDTMGSASAGDKHFDSNFKSILNWLPRQNYVATATVGGTYRIHAYDQPRLDPANRYALRIIKDSTREYWAEFRQKSHGGNAWIRDGILLNWDSWPSSNSGSQLLDTTPGSPDDRNDAALVIGRTFSDNEAGIHITPIGKGGTVPESMDVVVNFGTFQTNTPPTATVTASAATASTNASITFTAAADDADSDSLSYAWDFGDKTFSSTNSPVVSKSWSGAGEYVVRCVVSDMKGGTASDFVVVTVGSPGTFRAEGRITLGGQPLANVRVHNGLTGTTYRGSYTDSNGHYAITGLSAGTYTLGAALHGYTFSAGFPNPLTVGPNTSTADFVALESTRVSLSPSAASTVEGASVPARLTLTRTGSTASALAVNFLNPTGSAARGTDYTLTPDLTSVSPYYTATIPAGQASLDLVFTPTNDTTSEGPERAVFDLAPGSGYVIAGPGTAVVTIDDNDTALPMVSLAVTDPDAAESGHSAAIVIRRTGPTGSALTVRYAVSGTATSGTDYASLGTQVVIPAGQSSATLLLTPVDDALIEGSETVIVTLSTNAAYIRVAASADYTATLNLLDDDLPTVSVIAADAASGEAASDPGTFVITRTGSTSAPLTVNYAIGGSALHGVDYTPVPGSVTIPAGSSVSSVTIAPLDDGLGEPQQTAILQLRSGTTYLVGTASSATVNLTDSGDVPTVNIGVSDGVAGEATDTGAFRFTTAGTGTGNITVRYLVSGTATPGVDFTITGLDNASGIGTVSMGRNTTSTITVTPVNDTLIEGYEQLTVTILPDAAYTAFLDSSATLTLNDDDAPVVNVSITNETPGESGTTAKFWISRTGATTAALDVNYTMSGTATNGGDYATLSGVATIPAAASGVAVTITPVNDTLIEGTETVTLNLAAGSYGWGLASATHYLADNDTAPVSVKFASSTGGGLENVGTVDVPVTLTAAAASPVSVEYFIGGGSATGAVDYTFAVGTLTFAPGETALTLPLTIADDVIQEPGETVIVKLRNPNGAALGTSTFTYTITDNDVAPAPRIGFAAATSTVAEHAGTAPLIVSLSAAQTTAVTVDFSVAAGGTAISGADFTITAGTLTFAPGETAKIIPNTVADDALVESGETILLTLANPTGATLGPIVAHTCTIADNDAATVTIAASTPIARELARVPGQLRVTRTGATTSALTVNLATSGTATNGADCSAVAATATIAAGQTSVNIAVTPIDDGLIEVNETLVATVLPGTGYTVGAAASATVTILDHEPTVTLLATNPNAAELGNKAGTFMLTRTGPTAKALNVSLAFAGTATAGVDFATPDATVTIPIGSNSATLGITPLSDLLAEGPETVLASLAAMNGYTAGNPGSATITIADLPGDTWKASKFGANANNPAIAGDLANPDFDALPNLLEYALGTEPTAAGTAAITPQTEGTDLTLTYTRALTASELLFTIEELTAAGTWAPVSFTEEIVAATEMTQTVKARVPLQGAPGKIIRLRVARP